MNSYRKNSIVKEYQKNLSSLLQMPKDRWRFPFTNQPVEKGKGGKLEVVKLIP